MIVFHCDKHLPDLFIVKCCIKLLFQHMHSPHRNFCIVIGNSWHLTICYSSIHIRSYVRCIAYKCYGTIFFHFSITTSIFFRILAPWSRIITYNGYPVVRVCIFHRSLVCSTVYYLVAVMLKNQHMTEIIWNYNSNICHIENGATYFDGSFWRYTLHNYKIILNLGDSKY